LYTTIRNPKPTPNPNCNSTAITHPKLGHSDPQIVTVQIRPAPHFQSINQYLYSQQSAEKKEKEKEMHYNILSRAVSF